MSYITFKPTSRGRSNLTAPHRGFIFFNSANRSNRLYFNSGTLSKVAFITTPDLFFQNNGLHAANTGRSPNNAEIRRRLIHLAGGEQRAYILLRNTILAREHVLKHPPPRFVRGPHVHQLRIYKRWLNALGFNKQHLTIRRNTNLQGRFPNSPNNITRLPEHFRVNTELLGAIRALAREPSGPRARAVAAIHNMLLGRTALGPYFQNGANGAGRNGAQSASANGGARSASATTARRNRRRGSGRGGAQSAAANGGARSAAATTARRRRRRGGSNASRT